MATTAQLQARLEKLDAAIASGVLKIAHGDELLTYRNMAEMMQARAAIQQLIAASGSSNIVRTFQFSSDKGL